MDSDHYAVLGLPSGEEGARLSDKEIAKAYRVKALELHPDKRPNDPNANIFFQKLKASYEILRDRKARKEYDDRLRAKRRAAAATPPPITRVHGPWKKSLERFQTYKDLESQKMTQSSSFRIIYRVHAFSLLCVLLLLILLCQLYFQSAVLVTVSIY
ncbi:dnaJ homolog subfamily C member 17-like [Ipomoea triloba]|uniref:dnaJ homolog subfamily C member 17-like n=1 Tax=Ipomoea triloba TaxID=35885 RepID=UPI00125DC263|nr:dnaJ homolog subfamily C member 17-like [Ipomoea triloba]